MSVKLMTLVWDRTDLSQSETLVMLALADRSDDNGYCWPSVEGLAERARVTGRTVQRILLELADRELVSVERGGGRQTNRYTINVERLRGDNLSPVTRASPQPRHGRHPSGDTAMSPESSGTVKEPSGLNRVAWKSWVGYRKQKRWRYTAAGALQQMRWLSLFPQDEQALIVEQSVRQGYQGLFELKKAPKRNGAPPCAEERDAKERAQVIDLAQIFGMAQGDDDWPTFASKVMQRNERRLRTMT